MPAEHLVVALTFVLWIYATAGCWLLQIVCYPTYARVGAAEFVPFHVEFGRRLIPVFVVPAVLANLGSFALLAIRPAAMPWSDAAIAALGSVVILLTTALVEVPKHLALDRDGKSDALLRGLVRSNMPRVLGWTVGAAALAHAMLASFTPT